MSVAAGEPVGDVVGVGVGGGGSATALRHTTLIRTSASSLTVISHDGIDASSRNGAGHSACRGFAWFWRDNLCVVRSINLAFTDETELVPPIPRLAIGQ